MLDQRGFSTAFWCDELGLDTLVLEQAEQIGGQLHRVYNPIKNYLGLETRNGEELLELLRRTSMLRSLICGLVRSITRST